MIDQHKCEECGKEFTSCDHFDNVSQADVKEQKTCDVIDGSFREWFQVRCPECNDVVAEFGKW
jgi:uncharacterized protein with PIN domain